jgi:hypothetical protein
MIFPLFYIHPAERRLWFNDYAEAHRQSTIRLMQAYTAGIILPYIWIPFALDF